MPLSKMIPLGLIGLCLLRCNTVIHNVLLNTRRKRLETTRELTEIWIDFSQRQIRRGLTATGRILSKSKMTLGSRKRVHIRKLAHWLYHIMLYFSRMKLQFWKHHWSQNLNFTFAEPTIAIKFATIVQSIKIEKYL